MTRAFLEIAAVLPRCRRLAPPCAFRLEPHGWRGRRQHRHTVGVANRIGPEAGAFA